ncbi:hypothetical protein [Cupriavidus sp. L7L]|uniref:P-type ATPase n=1 Tax=Cupriavidus sp. L7L TaxID=2546443 RepID=UPI001FB66046|nr:hypothetical protein [Cupriavidus sp. L7L]
MGTELVPGDLVLLEAGGRVPADLRLIEATDLRCDESLLTGESLAVNNTELSGTERDLEAGFRDRAFAGTVTLRGRGRGVVEATGTATRMRQIASDLARTADFKPPLIVRLEHFSRMIGLAVGGAVALLMLFGLLR